MKHRLSDSKTKPAHLVEIGDRVYDGLEFVPVAKIIPAEPGHPMQMVGEDGHVWIVWPSHSVAVLR